MDRDAIAFFDLDGTLVAEQTQQLLVRYLRAKRLVGVADLIGVGLWFGAYKLGLVKPTDRARARGAQFMAGHTWVEIDELMREFASEVLKPRLHAGAVEALRGHQSEGEYVVVLSAAIQPLVEAVCRPLGVEACEGTRLELVEGLYSGRIEGRQLYGAEKAVVARRYLEERGVDPRRCFAYADHETDLELLRLVGRPVAVSPRPGLLRVATESGWRVIE